MNVAVEPSSGETRPAGVSASIVDDIDFANERAQRNKGARTVALTDSMPLQQHLANNDGGEAYEWHITRLPDDQIVPAQRVKQICMAMFADVTRSRARNAGWTDAQHRDAVLAGNDEFQKLSCTHPRLVLMLTGSGFNAKKLYSLLELIELRTMHEQQPELTLEEKQAHVSEYFQTKFVRPAEPGEEERAVREGTGMRATMAPMQQPPPVSARNK